METKLVGIEFGDGQRMRRVVSRSNHRVTGKHPSWKRGCMTYWESPLERDAFRRLDADSSVVMYEEQPARITYLVDGQTRDHYPDVLVDWKSTKGFLEVKTDRDAEDPEVRQRTGIMVELLGAFGLSYRVWRESEIRHQPTLDTDTHLLMLGRRPVPPIQRERIRRCFAIAPVIPWATLTGELGTDGVAHAARLVLEGMLVLDRAVPLAPTSLVRMNQDAGSLS